MIVKMMMFLASSAVLSDIISMLAVGCCGKNITLPIMFYTAFVSAVGECLAAFLFPSHGNTESSRITLARLVVCEST